MLISAIPSSCSIFSSLALFYMAAADVLLLIFLCTSVAADNVEKKGLLPPAVVAVFINGAIF